MRASPNQIAWRKFRTNIPAMLGLGYLCLCVGVALLGNLIAPDKTRHANYQILELSKMPPGSCAQLLLLPRQGAAVHNGFWELFTGQNQDHIPIPLKPDTSLEVQDGRVSYTVFSGLNEERPLSDFGEGMTKEALISHHVRKACFPLGTDNYGRDLLSRIILGARVSLAVGFMAVLISLLIGLSLGLLAGYFGGWIDRLVMWLVSVVWSIPTLLLALAISFVLGKGFWQLFVAIGLSMWVEVARMVRGQVMGVRELQFTEAAQALGYRSGRIMFKHVLPNVLSPIIVVAVANFGAAVLIESGLSFLGIGVEPPIPSWGRMIYEGYTYIMFESGQWLAFFPGSALIFLVISINLIGIGLRDAWDVKM